MHVTFVADGRRRAEPVHPRLRCEWLHMRDRFGSAAHDDARINGGPAPNGRGPHRDDGTDVDIVRRTATWLRVDPDGAREAGFTSEKDIRAMAALLDMLATELPRMDPAVRRATVSWCRVALDQAPGAGSGDATS
jgi:hypothetical protein